MLSGNGGKGKIRRKIFPPIVSYSKYVSGRWPFERRAVRMHKKSVYGLEEWIRDGLQARNVTNFRYELLSLKVKIGK